MNKYKIKTVPVIKDERLFHFIAMFLMGLLALYCIMPFFLMLSVSFSTEKALSTGGYTFWPKEVSVTAYDYLWAKRFTIGRSYALTILVTVFGTLGNLILTSLFAYPLSRKDFKLRNVFAFFVFFSIMFNGGLTATYIVWTQFFHIKNTIWAYILPGNFLSAFSILMVRNYFNANIPYEIIEASRIDGANDMKIYLRIMVPLSKPVMTTVGLFAALGYWNNWTNGMYYISDTKLYTIQVYLKKLMDSIAFLKSSSSAAEGMALAYKSLPTESARMAIAIIAILPILMVYPFIQKELVKGMVIGGVKG